MADAQSMRLFWVQLCLLSLYIIFTGLRMYVRTRMIRDMCADDWVILVALVMFMASVSISIRGTTTGAFGKASGPVPVWLHVRTLKGTYICEVLYTLISLAVRVSVCLFLLRIVNKRLHRRIIYALLVTVSAASVSYVFVTVFQCTPPSYFWNRLSEQTEGHCLRHQTLAAVGYLHGSVSTLSASVVGVLPVFILWNLRIDRRTKITIVTLLGMSVLACGALVARMITLSPNPISTSDSLHKIINTALWTMIEPGVAIIAACLPTLRPLFMKLIPDSARTSKAVASRRACAGRRSRLQERMPHWLELTTLDGRHLGTPRTPDERTLAWPADRDQSMWNVSIERASMPQTPPPIGITVHTAIEVTRDRRVSLGGAMQHQPSRGGGIFNSRLKAMVVYWTAV